MLARGPLTYGSKSNFFFLKDQIRFMIHAVTILATLRPIQVLLMEVIRTEEMAFNIESLKRYRNRTSYYITLKPYQCIGCRLELNIAVNTRFCLP